MVLGAKMPSSFTKMKNSLSYNNLNSDLINTTYNDEKNKNYYGRQISQPIRSYNSSNNVTLQWVDLWEKFDKSGILDDNLLDILWKGVIDQKPGLLGLMKKFDLICELNIVGAKVNGETLNREFLVPSRAKVNYDDEFDDEFKPKSKETYYNGYDSDDLEDIEDLSEHQYKKQLGSRLKQNNISVVEFYYDFCGFLPGLFFRLMIKIVLEFD